MPSISGVGIPRAAEPTGYSFWRRGDGNEPTTKQYQPFQTIKKNSTHLGRDIHQIPKVYHHVEHYGT